MAPDLATDAALHESEERHRLGAVLAATLPADHTASLTALENRVSGQRLQVLLAEDNLVNQSLIAAVLEKAGHQVVLAVDGLEALAAFERQPFDLILMDVQMPRMDGLAATEGIRAAEKTSGRHVPIVALTAHAMKGDRELCIGAGMDDYLTQPIDLSDLRATIRMWTERKSPVSPALQL